MQKQNAKIALCGILCCSLLLVGCTSDEPLSSMPKNDNTTHTTSTAVQTFPSDIAPSTSHPNGTQTTAISRPSITMTKPSRNNDKVLIDIPTIHQFPEYPTGCEAVSTVMALRYMGEEISVANFIDNHLPCSQQFYWKDNQYYGPNPYEYFLGNPRSENSYGCMAPVIQKALISYLNSHERIINATGNDLPVLCSQYIDNGYPVIVWTSIGMVPITNGPSWIMPDGNTFTWRNNEHCMLLVGYDNANYYFNDPYRGRVIGYARSITEQRYEQMGKQAVVIQ